MNIKKVGLGSMNPVKYRAVCDVFHRYLGVMPCQISQVKADSGVRKQPLTIDEIFRGAENRAEQARRDCDWGVGVESGCYPSERDSGYENVCVCAIYDGKRFISGRSFPFPLPPKITRKVVFGGMEIDEAAVVSGFTTNPDIGEGIGLIGLLTKRDIVRENMVRIATTNAVLQITSDNEKWYSD
jgi:inosine/xanthosine triphosphatase